MTVDEEAGADPVGLGDGWQRFPKRFLVSVLIAE
jgi:hypothetical protein